MQEKRKPESSKNCDSAVSGTTARPSFGGLKSWRLTNPLVLSDSLSSALAAQHDRAGRAIRQAHGRERAKPLDVARYRRVEWGGQAEDLEKRISVFSAMDASAPCPPRPTRSNGSSGSSKAPVPLSIAGAHWTWVDVPEVGRRTKNHPPCGGRHSPHRAREYSTRQSPSRRRAALETPGPSAAVGHALRQTDRICVRRRGLREASHMDRLLRIDLQPPSRYWRKGRSASNRAVASSSRLWMC